MANKQSAKKKAKQDIVRRERNRDRISRVRTALRHVEETIKAGEHAPAMESLRKATAELHSAASRGYLKLATASRKISRLNASIKKLAS